MFVYTSSHFFPVARGFLLLSSFFACLLAPLLSFPVLRALATPLWLVSLLGLLGCHCKALHFVVPAPLLFHFLSPPTPPHNSPDIPIFFCISPSIVLLRHLSSDFLSYFFVSFFCLKAFHLQLQYPQSVGACGLIQECSDREPQGVPGISLRRPPR